MAKEPIVISVFCNKGGVGKTTATINIAYILAEVYKLRVLAIDADAQCNLSSQLLRIPYPQSDIEDKEQLVDNFYETVSKARTSVQSNNNILTILDCYRPLLDVRQTERVDFLAKSRIDRVKLKSTKYPNLFFLPGDPDFSDIGANVAAAYMNKSRGDVDGAKIFTYLVKFIRAIAKNGTEFRQNNHDKGRRDSEDHGFDIVLIDLNPDTNILNANILLTSDYFFIPGYPDSFTNQGVKNFPRKLSNWIEQMQFYRQPHSAESVEAEVLQIPKPGKFLGYVALRYPGFRQSDSNKQDIVTRYGKWWDKIHNNIDAILLPKLKTMLVDNQNFPMVSENFHLFRYGIKEFHSIGGLSQEIGVPISDRDIVKYVSAELKRNEAIVKCDLFHQRFNHLTGLLIGNMSAKHLAQLQFAEIQSFSIFANLCGAVRYNDDHRKISLQVNGETLQARLYVGSQIKYSGISGLPVPLDAREIFKKLDKQCRNQKNSQIIDLIVDEMIAVTFYAFQMGDDELRPKSLRIARGVHQEVIDNLYDYTHRVANNRQQIDNGIKKLRDDIEKKLREIFSSKKDSYFNQFLDERINPPSESESNKDDQKKLHGKLSFLADEPNAIIINKETTSLLRAILLSLDEQEKFQLIIWQENSEKNLERLFEFVSNEKKPIAHLFYDKNDQSLKQISIEHRHVLAEEVKAGKNKKPLTDPESWYSAEDVQTIFSKICEKEQLDLQICQFLQPLRRITNNANGLTAIESDVFSKVVATAMSDDKKSIIPINIETEEVSRSQLERRDGTGYRWVALIVTPVQLSASDQPHIAYVDPRGTHLGEDVSGDLSSLLAKSEELSARDERWDVIKRIMQLIHANSENLLPTITVTKNQLCDQKRPADRAPWMILAAIDYIKHKDNNFTEIKNNNIEEIRKIHHDYVSDDDNPRPQKRLRSGGEGGLLSSSTLGMFGNSTARQKEKQRGYLAHEVDGSQGDCAFQSFGITRAAAFELLTDAIKITNEAGLANASKISESLEEVVKELILTSEDFCNYLKNKGAVSAGFDIQALRSTGNLNVYAKDKTVQEKALQYDIRDKLHRAGWAHPRILQALAYARNIELRLWKRDENTGEALAHRDNSHDYHLARPNGNSVQRKDILFVNNNHFELMEFRGYDNNSLPDGSAPVPFIGQAQCTSTFSI